MGSSSVSLPAWSCRPIGSLAGGIVPDITGERTNQIFTEEHRRRLRKLQDSAQNGELTAAEREEMTGPVSRWQQAYNDHQSKALEQERQADEAGNSQAGDGDAG